MYDVNETLDLVKLAQDGDEFAKEKLLIENSPLIKSVIKRYIDKGIEYDDLYQLGSLGFLKAINNFNVEFGVKFSTYAVPMIAGEIKRFIRDNGIIKVSRSVKALNLQINKFINEYVNEFDKSPNIDEIAKKFDISSQEVVFAMESGKRPMSLYSVINSEENNKNICIIDKIEDYNMENDMNLFLIYKEIKKLSLREQKIVMLRYFRDMTQKEIAELLGVSQVQVSRLENKIIEKLKAKVQ